MGSGLLVEIFRHLRAVSFLAHLKGFQRKQRIAMPVNTSRSRQIGH